ncbi:branched-chain amino acid transaminase [Actinomadura luteofluorescens]|uniref:branched-chain amino acid transaminase n=1 Tax=Actinomadura luteofluorescens TaxID=46163 RepID=UPI003D8C3406
MKPRHVLFRGRLVPYEDARLHVLTTTLKYGVGVFEGLRAYWKEDERELYIFRPHDHFRRLHDSLRVTGMDVPDGIDDLTGRLTELIKANDLRQNLHIRVQAFVDNDDGTPDATGPVVVSMATIPMENYFGRAALDVCVSSWARISERSMPPRVKAIANYQNSRLAMLEARADGYTGAILLTHEGSVSEGPGYNVFVVRDGRIATPRVTDAILQGVTRDTVLQLASRHLGVEVEERRIDRTELYLADEVFVCGSAAEVTAVASIDRRPVGGGGAGETTTALQWLYDAATRGTLDREQGWVEPVYHPETSDAGSGSRV